MAAYELSNVGDFTFYADAGNFIDDTVFLLLYVSIYQK